MAQSERNLTAIFTDTANAIRSKTGGTAQINPRDFADEIDSIQTGGGGAIVPGPNDNVIVYDYDGTVLDAKQVAVGAEYTLPEAPSHDGLTFESWSCSTAAVNGKITIPATKQVRVGATYHTTSGHVEIDVHAPKNIQITFNNSAWSNIDWGDGNITTNQFSHIYAQEGDYTIKILSNITFIPSGFMSPKIYSEIRLSNSITEISQNAFNSSYNLRTIVIPNSVINVGDGVFSYCYALRAVVIPNSLISFVSLFGDCRSLSVVVIPSGVTSIGNFYGAVALIDVVIPNTVSTIGASCFYNCYALQKAVISSGVTSIVNSMFQNCYALINIYIPSGVTSIGNNAFASCGYLARITIPSGVTSIGTEAFKYCSCCGVFDFSACQQVPTIQSNTFSNTSANAKIIVPDALYTDWIAASNWSDLASKIVKASEA